MVTAIIFPALRLEMCDIIAFVDERPNTWDTQYMSRPVIGVESMHIEQCDFLLIMCRGAKKVASRLNKDYAIPQNKMVIFDLYDSTPLKLAKKNGLKSPARILEMYLSSFSGVFEIIDIDILVNAPLAKSWIVPKISTNLSGEPVKIKYCQNLLNFLDFDANAIRPCCGFEAHHPPSGFTYTGGSLNMDSYREYINKCIEELQTDTYLCDGCSSLIETDKTLPQLLEEKFNFKNISFNSHKFFCNNKCVYCTCWQQIGGERKSTPYPIFEITKELIQKGIVDKNCEFRWGGGEPTISKEFEKTAQWLSSQGYYQFIFTSALKISPAIVAMLEAQKCTVLISIDSGSRDTYKKVKGIDGWDKVKNTCATYSSHSAKSELLILKYIIFDENNNISDISGFLDFCVQVGAKHVVYSLEFRENHAKSVSHQTLKAAAYFAHHAKQKGLHCQQAFIFGQYQSQIDELVKSM